MKTDPHLPALFARHSAELREATAALDDWHRQLIEVVGLLREAFSQGNKLLIAGNGGSATLAQHLSDELIGRYKSNRPPLPAIALTADSAVLTCIANDFGYDQVFARQIEALARPGDLFLAFSTSGKSPSILAAIAAARRVGAKSVAFTVAASPLAESADLAILSPATSTARVQELDLHAIHLICEAFEPQA